MKQFATKPAAYNQPMPPDNLSDVVIEKMAAEEWSAVRALHLGGVVKRRSKVAGIS